MADDSRLIVAIFENEAAATSAAAWLRRWNRSNKDVDDIKLGAMAVLTIGKEKEIKIRRVGRSAVTAGAEAGLIIGALAGLLTAGVGLLGGLAAGALVGGAAGRLIRKGLGVQPESLTELVDQLCAGRAALAVVAEDWAATAVTEQLVDLGGSTEVYECSLDELKQT